MAKKKEMLESKSIIRPLTVEEVLYHIQWLDKNQDHINFIQVTFLFPINNIFNVLTNNIFKNKNLTMILPSLIFSKCSLLPIG